MISCPQCNQHIEAAVAAGQQITCPHCNAQFVAPSESGASPARFVNSIKSKGFNPLIILAIAAPVVMLTSFCMCCGLCALVGEDSGGGPGTTTASRNDNAAGENTDGYEDDDGSDGGSSNSPGTSEVAVPESREEFSIVHFIDNTDAYKGSQLEIEMYFAPEYPDAMLRQFQGRFTTFMLQDLDSAALPNASFADGLIVRFKCTKGRLDSGNVATSVRRP